jgi:hypothetical protein
MIYGFIYIVCVVWWLWIIIVTLHGKNNIKIVPTCFGHLAQSQRYNLYIPDGRLSMVVLDYVNT